MDVDQILEIIETFFNAIKTMFAGLKDVFNTISGSETDAAEDGAQA